MTAPDILIVGGGFTGAALAGALGGRGWSVLVLEARAGKNPRFAGELIHPAGVEALERFGLLAPLRSGGVPIDGFAVIRERGASATVLPYRDIPGARPNGFAMEHREMVARLRATAERQPGIEIRVGERVVEVIRAAGRTIGVRTERGESIHAKLVLVAEGRHSKLRTQLGIEPSARLLSLTAAVLTRGEKLLPHPSYGHIFLGAWGPILAYPIASDQVRMCLDLPADGDKGADAIAERLRSAYAPYVPEPLREALLQALAQEPPEIAANYSISTPRCAVAGAALVGEAAGCSHPLTAAGMTICMNDVRSLVTEIGGLDLNDDAATDGALKRYEQRRYRFVRAREILADALYEVFRAAEPSTNALRRGIFRYWESGARARANSMALLSGVDSRLTTFLAEYLHVAARSTGVVLRGEVGIPTFSGRIESMLGLVEKATEKLGKVVDGVREGTIR